MSSHENLKKNWQQVEERIQNACARVGRRREDLTVVAITKKKSVEVIREAHALGQKSFGENYVQEALPKLSALKDLNLDWHFVGHLQSNKAKDVAGNFSLIHSVDRLSVAQALAQRAREKSCVQDILLELNVAEESSKSGVALAAADALYANCHELKGLRVRGVMTMPPLEATEAQARGYFSQVVRWGSQHQLKIFSMGTSHDFEWAIEEGATHLRLGTILLGQR